MALTYVGKLSLPDLVPSVYLALGQVSIAANASLQGNISLHASLQASPPTLPTVIAAAAEFQTQLEFALAAIPPVPSISFSVSDCVTLSASLTASVGYLLTLVGLLEAAVGIYAYAYSGTASSMGAAVTSALASTWGDGAPTNTSTTGLLFGATTSIAQTQMGAFLNGMSFVAPGLTYEGKSGLSAISPVTLHATSPGRSAIDVQLSAVADLKASLAVTPPTIAAAIQAEAKFLVNLQAQVELPDVKLLLAATASAIARLDVALCALGAALDRFDATLFVYTYSGLGNAMGADITSALASTWGDGTTPTSGACTAAILAATDSASATAMMAFFNGA